LWVLSMGLAYCHISGEYNLEVPLRFLGKFVDPWTTLILNISDSTELKDLTSRRPE
jgi:hypothetical protein